MAAHESSRKRSRRTVVALQIAIYCPGRGITSVIRGSTGETTSRAYRNGNFALNRGVRNGCAKKHLLRERIHQPADTDGYQQEGQEGPGEIFGAFHGFPLG